MEHDGSWIDGIVNFHDPPGFLLIRFESDCGLIADYDLRSDCMITLF